MKKQIISLLGLAFVFTLVATPILAADKIGYIDLMRIAREYTKAQDYKKALDDKESSYKVEIDKKANELKQYQEKMNLLSDKEKEAKREEFEGKIKALDDFVQQKRSDLSKADFDNTKEILKEIEDTVKQHAEKEGYSLVMDDRVLIYETKSMDITDKIIEILNKGYVKK
jgi:Skp family chaperone for outer membrane proteins